MAQQIMIIVVAAFIGGLIGGGALSAWWLKGLTEEFRKTFATVKDLNELANKSREDHDGIGSRVNAIETLTTQTIDRADEAHRMGERNQLLLEKHIENMSEHVVLPLNRIGQQLADMAQTQAIIADRMGLTLPRKIT